MMRCCRILALASAVALLVDLGVGWWWLSWGPFPESAWPA